MGFRRLLFYWVLVLLGSSALSGIVWGLYGIEDWGHTRAVRKLKQEWRIKHPPYVWSPPQDPAVLEALEDPKRREETILRMDLGRPTDPWAENPEYARSVPLPSRNGKEREIQIIFVPMGNGGWHLDWAIVEDGVEVKAGSSAFYFCHRG